MPAESVDVYADQLVVSLGTFGCALLFSLSSPGMPPQEAAKPVATIRLSIEHLKVMAYLLRQTVVDYENRTGVPVPIPNDVLEKLGVRAEFWRKFWESTDVGR